MISVRDNQTLVNIESGAQEDMLMSLEIINALIQAGIGVLALFIILAFIYFFPRNAEAIKGIVSQIRETTEAGIERVEGANTVLVQSIKMLQEVNQAALESRNRLEGRYEALVAEVAEVKRTFEAQIKAKDEEIKAKEAEIARLRAELDRANEERAREKREAEETMLLKETELKRVIEERNQLKERVEALERVGKSAEISAAKSEPDIKPAEDKGDENKAA